MTVTISALALHHFHVTLRPPAKDPKTEAKPVETTGKRKNTKKLVCSMIRSYHSNDRCTFLSLCLTLVISIQSIHYHPLQQRLLQLFILPRDNNILEFTTRQNSHHQRTTEIQIRFNTLRLNYTMRTSTDRLTQYWPVPHTRQDKS